MPRKTIRRVLPDFAKVLKHPSLGWAQPLVRDPNLLHLNRESVSLAFFIGIFSAFMPLPGQTFFAVALAFWWHANLPISIITVWIVRLDALWLFVLTNTWLDALLLTTRKASASFLRLCYARVNDQRAIRPAVAPDPTLLQRNDRLADS